MNWYFFLELLLTWCSVKGNTRNSPGTVIHCEQPWNVRIHSLVLTEGRKDHAILLTSGSLYNHSSCPQAQLRGSAMDNRSELMKTADTIKKIDLLHIVLTLWSKTSTFDFKFFIGNFTATTYCICDTLSTHQICGLSPSRWKFGHIVLCV